MSNAKRVRVLVVDDSAMVRKVLSIGLSADPSIEVVGTASNADIAWQLIQLHKPDVITLDVEMPHLDGLTFLRTFLPKMPIPTVMISSLTREGAQISLRALEAGAVDVISKPSLGMAGDGLPTIMADVCARVRAAASAKVEIGRVVRRPAPTPASTPAGNAISRLMPGARDVTTVLAIGSSTGGVQALSRILPQFPADAPAMVIVQHMPEGFTGPFAARIDGLCSVNVREARHGDLLEPGLVLIAPGGTRHMQLERHGRGYSVSLIDGDPVSFSRPSVDVLFNSVAKIVGKHAVAAVLTGMGRDGANGLLAIRAAGGRTFAQDEATSVVYGMPMAAYEIGAAEAVLALDDVPARMLQAATSRQTKV